jgi:hypothetical protein
VHLIRIRIRIDSKTLGESALCGFQRHPKHSKVIPVKKFFSCIFLSSLAFSAGCNKDGSSGGPGASSSAHKPTFGQADDTFNLTAASQTLSQGDAAQGMIGIKRGTNFQQDVTLAFTNLPKGVSFSPVGPVIKSGATDVSFTMTASDDAAPGEFTINVTGHPAKGSDASNQFKFTVAKKDTFTLNVPFWTTDLKQGEAKAVTIAISRDKRFDQDVSIKFNDLPKGVTVDPVDSVIKNGMPDAKFTIKAAADAALGDFKVTVTGHPVKGADAIHEFKFTVAKK